jgi:FkbM family methyltransferase
LRAALEACPAGKQRQRRRLPPARRGRQGVLLAGTFFFRRSYLAFRGSVLSTPGSEAGWILDAGAGEGFFSIYALEKGASSVIAVEPLPQLKPSLEKTLGQYATRERFRVVSAGLGDAGGFSFLKEDSPRSCETHLAEHPAGSGRKVPVVTVDSLADQHGLAGNGFVKMDIEGAEMAALEGAMRTLARHRPKLAVAVYHGYENAQRCKEIILKGNAGYTVEFRGMYGWLHPPRPYMLFAW